VIARPGLSLSPRRRSRQSRGQSIAEFAMVFPVLLLLLVAIVDFTRVFAAGIVLEAATRNAAEIAAEAYVQVPPPGAPLSSPAPTPADPAYYNALYDKTARVVCAETKELPGADFTGGACPTWPNVRVCVHDNVMDNGCGAAIAGFASSVPAECTELNDPWTAASSGGTTSKRYVEVRTCLPFNLLFDLPFIPLNDIYLQRTRTFVIPCYFALGQDDCG
jgi:hypothetical protein